MAIFSRAGANFFFIPLSDPIVDRIEAENINQLLMKNKIPLKSRSFVT